MIPEGNGNPNFFPTINEEDEIGNASLALLENSSSAELKPRRQDSGEMIRVGASPGINPLTLSNDRMFNKLIAPEQNTMELAISRADFNAANLMMSVDTNLDVRRDLERL